MKAELAQSRWRVGTASSRPWDTARMMARGGWTTQSAAREAVGWVWAPGTFQRGKSCCRKTGQHPRQTRSSHCKAELPGIAQLQWDEQLCLEGELRVGKSKLKAPLPRHYLPWATQLSHLGPKSKQLRWAWRRSTVGRGFHRGSGLCWSRTESGGGAQKQWMTVLMCNQHLLCVRHCLQGLGCVNSWNPHNRLVPFLFLS